MPIFWMLIGLAMQATAVIIVVRFLRGRILSHVGALFVIMVFVYHGLTEIIQYLFPGFNFYRRLVSQEYINIWMAIVGLAILVFSIVYCLRLSSGFKREPELSRVREPVSSEMPDWRAIFLITFPSFFLAIFGSMEMGYVISGLLSQFLAIGIILAFFSVTLRRHGKSLLPILVVQSLIFALVSSRFLVIAGSITLLSTCQRFGLRIKARQVIAIVFISIVLVVSMSAARVLVGRHIPGDTSGERAAAYISGSEVLFGHSTASTKSIQQDFIYRFDGNTFGGMIVEGISHGYPYAGSRPLKIDLSLLVPSFISPEKLNVEISMLSEKVYISETYMLPSGIDYIPGTLGILFGCYGIPGLMVAVFLLGWAFAWVDLWLRERHTQFSLLVGVGLTMCVLLYEQGVFIYLLTFRSILVMYLIILLVSKLLSAAKHKDSEILQKTEISDSD